MYRLETTASDFRLVDRGRTIEIADRAALRMVFDRSLIHRPFNDRETGLYS